MVQVRKTCQIYRAVPLFPINLGSSLFLCVATVERCASQCQLRKWHDLAANLTGAPMAHCGRCISSRRFCLRSCRDFKCAWGGGGGESRGENGISSSSARFGLHPSINAVRGSSDPIQSSSTHGTLGTLSVGPAGSTDKSLEPGGVGRSNYF